MNFSFPSFFSNQILKKIVIVLLLVVILETALGFTFFISKNATTDKPLITNPSAIQTISFPEEKAVYLNMSTQCGSLSAGNGELFGRLLTHSKENPDTIGSLGDGGGQNELRLFSQESSKLTKVGVVPENFVTITSYKVDDSCQNMYVAGMTEDGKSSIFWIDMNSHHGRVIWENDVNQPKYPSFQVAEVHQALGRYVLLYLHRATFLTRSTDNSLDFTSPIYSDFEKVFLPVLVNTTNSNEVSFGVKSETKSLVNIQLDLSENTLRYDIGNPYASPTPKNSVKLP